MSTKSSSLQQLIRGTPHETHRDRTYFSQEYSRPTTFRNAPDQAGTDDDFGRFASGSGSNQGHAGSSRESGTIYSTPLASTYNSTFSYPPDTSEADPNSILNLLNSKGFTSAVQGSWEEDLLVDQAIPWKQDSQPHQTTDPLSLKGKGRADVSEEEIILSSLSSLQIKDITYLQTLLSLPESDSIQDYLKQGSYSQDIYGVQNTVRTLLREVESGGNEMEEGRVKAVRRLGLVMKHLWGENLDQVQTSSGKGKDKAREFVGMEGEVENASQRNASEWDQDNANRSLFNQHSNLSHPIHVASNYQFLSVESPSLSLVPNSLATAMLSTTLSSQSAQKVSHQDQTPDRQQTERMDVDEKPQELAPFAQFMGQQLEMLKTDKGPKFTVG